MIDVRSEKKKRGMGWEGMEWDGKHNNVKGREGTGKS